VPGDAKCHERPNQLPRCLERVDRGPFFMNGSIADLEKRANTGDGEAQLDLARHFEMQSKPMMARGWFARAAKNGSVEALRSLAINLLTQEPVEGDTGVNMIRMAADKGDAEAAYVCAMLAAQDSDLEKRWEAARECLGHAAERGFSLASQQLEFLRRSHVDGDMGALTSALPGRVIFDSPRIVAIEGCVSTETCDWLIERARPRVARAQVYDPAVGGGRLEQARTNSSVEFNIAQSDMILMILRARIAAIAGLPLESLEASSALHYAPGQKFEPHFDFLDPTVAGYAMDMAKSGQRVATFLLYLNDDYEGGETDFPSLRWRHKGRKGDALLFWNVDPSGLPDRQTLHAGLPPTLGEKWLLSQWLRQAPMR
jgi:prolyl 4-hydroxylase